MTGRHPDLVEFDRAVAEFEVRQLADELGYDFGVLTDGTIVLEPPVPAQPPAISADSCADCGVTLNPTNRCQLVDYTRTPGVAVLVYLCPEHYAAGKTR